MRRYIPMVLTATLLIAADGPQDDAAKKELEKLQGTWKIVSVERVGKVSSCASKPATKWRLKTSQSMVC